jgi:putative acetyltransferase
VADQDGRIEGHILFTPVDIGDVPVRGYGLAPVAVRPERQRRGIGASLVRAGIERVRQTAAPFVVVIGHPAYYPRFGFTRASEYGIRAAWDGIPDDAVMLLLIDPAAASRLAGIARYRPEFDGV